MGKVLTLAEVIALLEALIEQEGSQTNAALRLGVTLQYLNGVLKGRAKPGQKILKYFGLERVKSYIYKQK